MAPNATPRNGCALSGSGRYRVALQRELRSSRAGL
jgi:hypothetical protein